MRGQWRKYKHNEKILEPSSFKVLFNIIFQLEKWKWIKQETLEVGVPEPRDRAKESEEREEADIAGPSLPALFPSLHLFLMVIIHCLSSFTNSLSVKSPADLSPAKCGGNDSKT